MIDPEGGDSRRLDKRSSRIKTANKTDRHIGQRIRARRNWLRMTQEKLAQALNLSFQQVQKYEKGLNRVSASRLTHLAAILGVSVGYFLDDIPVQMLDQSDLDDSNRSDRHEQDRFKCTETRQLMKSFLQIPNQTLRQQLVELITTLAVERQSDRRS